MNDRGAVGAAIALAAGLAGLGGLLIVEATGIPDRAGYAGVGPGDILWVIGACLVGLAAWTALDGLRGGMEPAPEWDAGPVLWIVGGLLAQLLLFRVAGFAPASTLLFAATAAGFGERRFHVSLPAGLILSLAVYGLFDGLLDLNLPGGPLEHAIFGG